MAKLAANGNEKIRRKPTGGLYANARGRLEDWVNSFMHNDVGVKDQMNSYLLRRDCSKFTIEHEGVLAEAQKLGHSPRIAFTQYTDISKVRIPERV